ncbi:MAG TPA: RNA-binding protein [Phenylobacterium sp.]
MTLAQVSRERRDAVSGEVMAEERLIRFVEGPGGIVTPDLARKLPGRGVWVAADRASLEAAVKKNAFARSAKTKLTAPPNLADQVETLLTRRLLDGLGLARRAGELISGFEKTAAAITSGRARWLVEATDGAEDGRRKLLALTRKSPAPPELFGVFTSEQLGLALGLENVIHTAFLAGRAAERWTADVRRLSGFRPLLPKDWREEPVSGDGA